MSDKSAVVNPPKYVTIEATEAERNLILRLRSLRDKARLVWLEVTPTMLAIVTMQDMKRETMGE